MALKNNLKTGQRAQRKLLITVAEWVGDGSGTYGDDNKHYRELLGSRTEDSSIEFNADIATSTDILGVTHTDVNKTEPQQSFDPFYIMGGSDLSAYLTDAALKNDIDAYNGTFNIYVITGFISDDSVSTKYYAVKHEGCSIIPVSIGGDSYVSMPIEVHYSNNITEGTVDKFTGPDFTFTAA